jgi:glutamate racemase
MIGIFDSGLGGLTVVKAVMEHLPGYDLTYFGDTARTPYGSKSPETVSGYAKENTDFLIDKGARIIVVACNSASSVATDRLKADYDIPVFEVITPAVDMALAASRKHAIGIIGTRATINSGVYQKKILKRDPGASVHTAPCPLLVPLVEEGWMKKPETRMIVKKYLLPLKTRQIDTLILGCTHYPLLKDIIQVKIGRRVTVIDSSVAVAQQIKAYISTNAGMIKELPRNGTARFYVSDITEQFKKIAPAMLKRKISLERVVL